VETIKRVGGNAFAVQVSVAKNEEIERVFAETEKALSKVDPVAELVAILAVRL
jgi:3-oxoacyl-[acyl-carrier protein] reductase